MLSDLQKVTKGVFAKRFEKIKRILLALNQRQTTTYLTVDHLTAIESPRWGIQLLPSSLLAPGCTAKPLRFCFLNGLTVSNYELYEKKRKRKGSGEALERLRTSDLRESPHIDLNWRAAQPSTVPEPLHH